VLAGNYLSFYDNLSEAIRRGGSLEVTGKQAEQVIRIIEAAYQSGQERRVVTLE
jgi:hypothetical protein